MKTQLNIFNFTSLLFFTFFGICSCVSGSQDNSRQNNEDRKAKELLQGIWLNSDDHEVTMMVTGDTIYYADALHTPVAFAVFNDSLVIYGFHQNRYAIINQTENLFSFKNQAGDVVKLYKSTDKNDIYIFKTKPSFKLNQGEVIKRDSVLSYKDRTYHAYIQINPTTFKVIRTSYNQDGIEVDNVFYDNIINVCVYDGGRKLFSKDFYKKDFVKYVPSDFLSQSILSDVVIDSGKDGCIQFLAQICMPDSQISYQVGIQVYADGTFTLRQL